MKIERATTAIFLETRTPKKDNTCPVKLRITYKRERKYYAMNVSLTQEDFFRVFSTKAKPKDKELRNKLDAIEEHAKEIIDDLPEFSFTLFENDFFKEENTSDNVYDAYENYIEKLRKNEQIGTMQSYRQSLKSIKEFAKKKNLQFSEITPEFLKNYDKWCMNLQKSPTTVGIHLRALRTLINEAIANGIIKQENYPFGRNKYMIPTSRNVKKALDISVVEQIMKYEANTQNSEAFARDMWIFSYLCNGMNIADLARLKYKNIDGDKLIFTREKTKRTTRHNSKPIIAIILPPAQDIIDRWGIKPKDQEQYIFPIIKTLNNYEKQYAEIKQGTKTINKYMKRIAVNLGLDEKITTYFARHTFSTIIMQSGGNELFIGDNLGHSNPSTTKSYLGSFVDDTKRQIMQNLIKFDKN